ncbi:DUF2288 domain-containing protein [Massilia sp. TS11]|uniref:DUF2288 domain-containing protein n=1 Tax=Massilia sp. TS11 TaxID=2908003 RepID=UPI001EDB9F78|nr:DUF2288 domain-containing protein [Massilia sp. TS11]MCG2584592.1 DUF2288 domain-containing protein [Massilia sp. TS11]
MKLEPEKDTELFAKINRETAKIPWSELVRHFAQGNVVYVSEELDLVRVAMHIAHDDKEAVQRWMAEGKLAKVSDEQAQAWTAADLELWASVISPFILVQPPRQRLH